MFFKIAKRPFKGRNSFSVHRKLLKCSLCHFKIKYCKRVLNVTLKKIAKKYYFFNMFLTDPDLEVSIFVNIFEFHLVP
jgi:hypothetical protein